MFIVKGANARSAGAIKQLNAGVSGQMAMGDGRAFLIAGPLLRRLMRG